MLVGSTNPFLEVRPTATPKRPHFRVSVLMLFRLMCHRKGTSLSVAIYMYVSVYSMINIKFSASSPANRTSTVSSTFITPGWRSVRSFLSAFLAIGKRDLFAVTSKENMLQFDPSSYKKTSAHLPWDGLIIAHALGSIVQSPNAGINIYSVAEGVWKRRAFRYC